MSWFNRKDKKISEDKKKNIPSGLWIKCPTCSEIKYKPELEKNFSVCIGCNHHFRVSPSTYRDLILDNANFHLNTKNYNFFIKLLDENFINGNLIIKNSNIFFRNSMNEVLFITNIFKMKYYFDSKELKNIFY